MAMLPESTAPGARGGRAPRIRRAAAPGHGLRRAAGILLLALPLALTPRRSAGATAMMFCNGNMGSAAGLTSAQIAGLRASGFTTMVLFTMTVQANGDFTFGDGSTVSSGGVYGGPTNWPSLLSQCRQAPSGISRIEMCIGGWGDPSFANIKSLIAANGTGSGTVLYRNLATIRTVLGIDAVDYDDESTYDSPSAISFGQMCAAVGMKVTLCPYMNAGYWQAVKAGLGANCDQVYLQCYQGGAGNDPATWNTYFGGLKVIPGYWDWERDNTFLNDMQSWKSAGGSGGFLWPSCTGCNPPAGPGEMAQYAYQILNTFNPVVTPITAAEVVGGQVTFTVTIPSGTPACQWQVVRGGVTNNLAGATNTTLTLTNLQLTNAASYQVVVSGSTGVMVSSAGALAVSTPPAAVNNVISAGAAQTGLGYGFTFTPTWTLPAGSMVSGAAPAGTNGDFTLEIPGRNVDSLTAGGSLAPTAVAGTSGTTTSTNYVTCGNGSGAGATVIYSLTNFCAAGCALSNVVVYGGWADAGRDQQAYTVSYSKMSAPATFLPLGTVSFLPVNTASVPCATRVALSPASGALATNVAAVKFDFTNPSSENGYCGYAQIQLFGAPQSPQVTMNTSPVTAAEVVGGQVSFTVGFSSAGPLSYQWRVIRGGTTNTIPGATNATLTLTNLQLTDTAAYQAQASNPYGTALGAPGALTVTSVSAAVNNVIISCAGQTGSGSGTFIPTWTVTTNNSLIAGQLPGTASGNFSLEQPGRSVGSLTTGGSAPITRIAGTSGFTTSTDYVTCGNGGGAGATLIYPLTSTTNGFNLTNIMVYGGWADAGRDQQAYTVWYSTALAPATFILLGTVNYNPANPTNTQSATRATLRAAAGFLATNAAAVKFDFTSPVSENGYCGYSQIEILGTPVAVPPATNRIDLGFVATTTNLTIQWPANHTGWRLLAQTNNAGAGLGATWWPVAEAAATNHMTVPLNPANGSVFYRLVYP